MSESELIKDLIEQPAKVYIDKNDYQQGFIDGVNQMIKELEGERQMGEWKPFDLTYRQSIYSCSVCQRTTEVPTSMGEPLYNYCPNCGARMIK